jgi:DNA-directed RNA polymerase subunit H (RpoH/RPB5)
MDDQNVEVTKHILVPKHEKINQEETEALLEKYNISLMQLPKIFVSDPAIEHLEVEINDVIKIMRNSPTMGKSNYYRVVING